MDFTEASVCFTISCSSKIQIGSGSSSQSPEGHKMDACVCVCVCVLIQFNMLTCSMTINKMAVKMTRVCMYMCESSIVSH